MAKVKRSADKDLIKEGKKARVSATSSEDNQDAASSPAEATETVSTHDASFSDLINQLQGIQSETIKREKWVTSFKDEMKKRKGEVSQQIDAAKQQIEKDEAAFQNQMLMIFTSLTHGLEMKHGAEVSVRRPLELKQEDISKMKPVTKADLVVDQSKDLIDCYQSLRIPVEDKQASRIREIFGADQAETTKAFEASRKFAVNQLQEQFADKTGEVRNEYLPIDEKEKMLAKKIMSRNKTGTDSAGEDGHRIGALLHKFGEVVGKMQSLVD